MILEGLVGKLACWTQTGHRGDTLLCAFGGCCYGDFRRSQKSTKCWEWTMVPSRLPHVTNKQGSSESVMTLSILSKENAYISYILSWEKGFCQALLYNVFQFSFLTWNFIGSSLQRFSLTLASLDWKMYFIATIASLNMMISTFVRFWR
jgi:hypothetical protein